MTTAKKAPAKKPKKTETPPASTAVLAYKAFDKDFQCRGYQYKVGETYEHKGEVRVCNSGFHSCSYPMDVWNYYPILESRFAEVEVDGQLDTHDEDSKISSSKLHVKAEINIAQMITASVDWHFNGWFKKAKKDDVTASETPNSKLAASGNYSNLAASGDGSNLAASGDDSNLAASGYGSKLAASGYGSNLAASGYGSKLAASGNYSNLAASGYGSKLAASGGGSNVIVSAEKDIMVKGSINTLICLTHYVDGKPIGFTTGRIGEDGLEPDVWYMLDVAGKFKKTEA